MAKEAFIPNKMSTAHKYVVRQANEIISEYMAAGYTLTLRQIYYQFVARDLIENKQTEYKRLGKILDAGRKMGLIDWDAIEDRTRNLRGTQTWADPQSIVKGAANGFKLNPWEEQRVHVEVWIEKDALVGVIQPTCARFRVDYFACRGYSSQSEAYSAGKRLAHYANAGYRVLVLHLGDHDPSGLDMTNDNRKRLALFSGQDIEFRRIALNMDQIEEYSPPPNFAKETDSRTTWYRSEFNTDSSWELDALEPKVIDALISSNIDPMIDKAKWDATIEREKGHREVLRGVEQNWSRVAEKPWLQKRPAEILAEASATVRAYEPINAEIENPLAALQSAADEVDTISLEIE
jgi:hypothetical protein